MSVLRLSSLAQSLGYIVYMTADRDGDVVHNVTVLSRMDNSVNEVAIQYLPIPA